MSTTIWPPLEASELRQREAESLANELAWLLESLQETLENLKAGLEECHTLLAPTSPGSTLVVSSLRSEAVKGTMTRVGTRLVKGSLSLRLKTVHPATTYTLSSTAEISLPALAHVRSLLNGALDCVDITRWTGDRHSASFISGQLRLLHGILAEARGHLRGHTSADATDAEIGSHAAVVATWPSELLNAAIFSPRLPDDLCLHVEIVDAALVFTVRGLEDAERDVGFGTKFAYAIGAARRLEHDEMDGIYTIPEAGGATGTGTGVRPGSSGRRPVARQVRIKEKVRVESGDPSLMTVMAKIAALEHNVGMARRCLAVVMGDEMDEL